MTEKVFKANVGEVCMYVGRARVCAGDNIINLELKAC